jgi:hypothetical protein
MKASVLVALGLLVAQAAEPTGTLTLACEGTRTSTLGPDAKPEPISTRVIVNFTTRTVHGFGSGLLGYPVEITGVNEVTIAFGGASKPNNVGQHSIISGAVDLATGELGATSAVWGTTGAVSTNYSLKCKPTQRMF